MTQIIDKEVEYFVYRYSSFVDAERLDTEIRELLRLTANQARSDAIGEVEAAIEKARIDDMFIEWNGLNMCEIGELKGALQQLKDKGVE